MKKYLLLCCCFLAMAQISYAQSDSIRFQIVITDTTKISSIVHSGGSTTPVFTISSLNSIVAGYNITEFQQAYPSAHYQYLRSIYHVRCNSLALASALHTANPTLFPEYNIITQGQPLSTRYTPNDWGIVYGGHGYFDYINAREAWAVTKGDPSVVIGLTDTYFDMGFDEMYTNVARISGNAVIPSIDAEHGTEVAGIVGAATDNAKGFPGLAFNCQLDLSTDRSTEGMLQLSAHGTRIINASWADGNSRNLTLTPHFYDQDIYNDIYENGTLACAAAGNGPGTSAAAYYYGFPASLDHVFSTTNVCWSNPVSTPLALNSIGVHENYVGDTVHCYQHNTRVDICAPAVGVGGITFNPSDPTDHYASSLWGTSIASPMTAAVAGLVQSALKQRHGFADANWSPYQLEWILKVTADASILSKTENLRYAGRLGAGVLNAEAAVEKAIDPSFDPNNAATQTMYIKGIDINTVCAPGFSSNGVKPQLKPIIVNGTPPYQYVWEQVPWRNFATLDNEHIEQPTVMTSWDSNIVYFRLTVYDNSPIAQQVAMKTFKIQLITSGYDLAMQDSYMDMLNEPNDQRIFDNRNWDTWTSPDLWNRQNLDGGIEHQNPEYFISNPNYAYIRVRNIGCASNPGDRHLRVYWSKGSTGENWDADWKTTDVAAQVGHPPLPGGREITTGSGITIPVLQPGDNTVISQAWYPPKPQDYAGTPPPNSFDLCLLARIEEPFYVTGSVYHTFGMNIPEIYGTGVGVNVRNNNNIATRNMVLTNLNLFDRRTDTRQLIIANGNNVTSVFNFDFGSDRSIFRHFAGDFSSLGHVTLHLGSLYDRWVAGGSQGVVASSDAQNKTVTFNGAKTLQLNGLSLAANERFTINVEFVLDSNAVINDTSKHVFFARQFDQSNVDEPYGAMNYQVTVNPSTPIIPSTSRLMSNDSTSVNGSYKLSPNPTSNFVAVSYTGGDTNPVDIVVTDMTGKKVWTEQYQFGAGTAHNINLSRFPTGVYLINITNTAGKTEVYKVVKE
jgi:hypothetical protein